MKKVLNKITIDGQLIGNIWMPYTECTKDFSFTFTPTDKPFSRRWTGLRDAVLQITNDGDFRACQINYAVITVTYSIGKNRTETIFKELKPCKLIADCMAA